jgi:hypothetical protein
VSDLAWNYVDLDALLVLSPRRLGLLWLKDLVELTLLSFEGLVLVAAFELPRRLRSRAP